MNVKVTNQVGTRVKLKADKILPSAVLSSGEIFVYHELLNGTDRLANINLQAVDEYTDQPLLLNGETKFTVSPVTYDHLQEAYVTREGELIVSFGSVTVVESPRPLTPILGFCCTLGYPRLVTCNQ